ncbi:MAG: site-specific integrase [Comamonadaceae bacterium]|nr:site-specific integrase [Comamonadaceae bacterium]
MSSPIERSSIAKAAQEKSKPDKPVDVRSDRVRGLLLRILPSGLRTYYVQVARGQRVKIGPAGTYTLRQAEERAKEITINPELAVRKKASALSLDEYITQHYSDHALAKLKNGQKSIDRVKSVWQKFLNKRLSDLTAREIDKFRDKRINAGVAPATVNRDVSALSGVLSHWAKNNEGSVHPLAELEALQVADDETVRYLLPDESKRLRQALADRDAEAATARLSANKWRAVRGKEAMLEIKGYCDHMTPMVLLSLNTGMRQGELFSLAWENVDLSLKTITVLASHSKGNNTRVIPLNVEAHTVLTTIKPDVAKGLVFKSPVTGARFDNVKKAWAEIAKAAALPDLRWHDLRHDFASQLVMKGAPLFTVQKLLGHANSRMTQRYAKLAPSTLADAVGLL